MEATDTLTSERAAAEGAPEAAGVTRRLAQLVHGVEYADLPEAAIARARDAIIDYFACAVAGAPTETARKLLDFLPQVAGTGEATIAGTTGRSTAAGAALANGTLSHALDYDDVSWEMIGHPGVSILPAVVALGELRGASGTDVVVAYVTGFEVASQLGMTMNRDHYERGWHATGTLGTMGATAGAGKLLGLDVDELVTAFGIGASLASGLRANFGTDTKPFHAGRAAQNGVIAATLAASGFTADDGILEAGSGFFNVLGGGPIDPERVIRRFGEPWGIADPGYNTKFYPSCVSTHAGIDSTLELVREHDIQPEDIAAIDVGVVDLTTKILIHNDPHTGLEGKFSMQYCVSRAVCDREVVTEHFTDAAVNQPAVRAVLERVTMAVDEEINREWQMGTPRGARCTITLRDGRQVATRVDWPTGSIRRPLSPEQLRRKYLDCVSGIVTDEAASESLTRLEALQAVADIREITGPLTDIAG